MMTTENQMLTTTAPFTHPVDLLLLLLLDHQPHQADEAHHIGPSPTTESYLVKEKIVEAAVRSGAQALHPGYGFLSENADFADMCEKAGVVYIGKQ